MCMQVQYLDPAGYGCGIAKVCEVFAENILACLEPDSTDEFNSPIRASHCLLVSITHIIWGGGGEGWEFKAKMFGLSDI